MKQCRKCLVTWLWRQSEVSLSFSFEIDLQPWIQLVWHLASLLVCWELCREILGFCRLTVVCLCYITNFILRVLAFVRAPDRGASGTQCGPPFPSRTEQDSDLTCMAGAGGSPLCGLQVAKLFQSLQLLCHTLASWRIFSPFSHSVDIYVTCVSLVAVFTSGPKSAEQVYTCLLAGHWPSEFSSMNFRPTGQRVWSLRDGLGLACKRWLDCTQWSPMSPKKTETPKGTPKVGVLKAGQTHGAKDIGS